MVKHKYYSKNIYYFFISFLFIIRKTKSFLIISMSLLSVDDCLKKIYLDEGSILYQRLTGGCSFNGLSYNTILFAPIPYDIGQTIYVDIGDIGGECGIKIITNINNNQINPEDPEAKKCWTCSNCEGEGKNYIYDNINKQFLCYNENSHPVINGQFYTFTFYFQIKSFLELGLSTSEYFYYLTNQNYFYISPPDLNQIINLIELYSINNLYAKNDEEIIKPFYEYIKYKLIFDNFSSYSGKFIGTDNNNNDIELTEYTFSTISPNKNLRYELSESEIKNNGIHLRFKIGIYNNQDKLISNLTDFNFFICLNGYQFVNIDTSMKCLKEGFYELNNKYYSCYETCDNCDTFKKPENSNYFKNYCDSCKSNYSYYINMKEEKEGNIKIYKSCYEECRLMRFL